MGNHLNCTAPQNEKPPSSLARGIKERYSIRWDGGLHVRNRRRPRKVPQLPTHLTRSTPQLFTFDTPNSSYKSTEALNERGEADGQEKSSHESIDASVRLRRLRRYPAHGRRSLFTSRQAHSDYIRTGSTHSRQTHSDYISTDSTHQLPHQRLTFPDQPAPQPAEPVKLNPEVHEWSAHPRLASVGLSNENSVNRRLPTERPFTEKQASNNHVDSRPRRVPPLPSEPPISSSDIYERIDFISTRDLHKSFPPVIQFPPPPPLETLDEHPTFQDAKNLRTENHYMNVTHTLMGNQLHDNEDDFTDDERSIQLLDECRNTTCDSNSMSTSFSDSDDCNIYEKLVVKEPEVANSTNLLACRRISKSMFELSPDCESFYTNAVYFTAAEVAADLTQRHTKALCMCERVIAQQLVPELVLNELVSRGVFTGEDVFNVTQTRSRENSRHQIAAKLTHIDEQQFISFIQILKEAQCHQHLASLLTVLNGVFEVIECTEQREPTKVDQNGNASRDAVKSGYQTQIVYYDSESGTKKSILRMPSMKGKLLENIRGISSVLNESGAEPSRFVPLISLDLSGLSLHNNGVRLLATKLEEQQCLINLSLGSNNISTDGIIALTPFLKGSKTIQTLDLRLNPLRDSGLRQLCIALEQNETLTILNIQDIGLTTFEPLTKYVSRSKTLNELDISYNAINVESITTIQQAILLSHSLRTLRVHACGLTLQTWNELCAAVCSSKSLRVLDIGANRVGDEGAAAICALLTTTSISQLVIADCDFSPVVCTQLASVLSTNTHLETLDLSRNDLLDAGVEHLCSAFDSQCQVQSLKLNICSITYSGFLTLLKVADRTGLQNVQLCFNRISFTNKGDEQRTLRTRLAQLKSKNNFTVQLWGNEIEPYLNLP